MKRYQNTAKLPRSWKSQKYSTAPSTMMVNPNLLESVRSLGSMLQEISIEALGLEARIVEKLKAAGIFTLEQLASSNETTVLMIPQFGVGKVKQIKANLKSYLISMLKLYKPEFEESGELAQIEIPKLEIPRKKPTSLSSKKNSSLQFGYLYKNLRQLERRVRSLESRKVRGIKHIK